MWLIKVFCVISLSALCAAQEPDEDAASTAILIPILSLDLPAGQIFAGESASFSCSVVGGSPDWTYLFFHYNQGKPLSSPDPSSTSLTISHSKLTDSGTYWCQVKRGEELSAVSNSISLVVNDPPTPSLLLESGWLDVLPSERAEFRCSIPGSSDWTLIWYKDGQELSETDSVISAAEGSYVCKGRHKTQDVTTPDSKPLQLRVHASKPKSTVTQTPKHDPMYIGETVTLRCGVNVSSGWEYVWFRNGKELGAKGNYTLNSPNQLDGGQYTCRAQRGESPVFSEESEPVTLQFSDPPKPSVKPVTPWLDVFEVEELELSCEISDSDWSFTWYKNGQTLSEDDNRSQEGSLLSIWSPTQTDQGLYSCQAHHIFRGVTSQLSDEASVTVYGSTPKPTLSRDPGFKQTFVGETVTLTCRVDVSSGWGYLWFRGGTGIDIFDTSNATYTISSPRLADSGEYSCQAFRNNETVLTEQSETVTLDVVEIPVPTLKLRTPWLDVFPSESVNMSCGVQGSSDWTYVWYKDERELQADNSLSFELDGAVLSVKSASGSHGGQYKCQGRHKSRSVPTDITSGLILRVYDRKPIVTLEQNPVYAVMYTGESLLLSCHINISSGWEYLWYKDGKRLSESGNTLTISSAVTADSGSYKCQAKRGNDIAFSTDSTQALSLNIEANKPKPLITQDPNVEKIYNGESVSFQCGVQASSGWEYLWYKDGEELPHRGSSFDIHEVNSSNSGIYHCMARRGKTTFNTENSEVRRLRVSEIPVPSLKRTTPWLDVFPSENVKLSCGVQGSSDWMYTWYKDERKLQADNSLSFELDGAVLSVKSASASHGGQYKCQGRHKSRSVPTNVTSGLILRVYDRKPIVTLEQNPVYAVMYTGESLLLSCHINISSGWEYLWYQDGKRLSESGNTLTISSAVTADRGSYKCQAKRGKDIAFSTYSTRALSLNIEANKPKPLITQDPNVEKIYNGESVSFQCGVQASSGWEYLWYKDGEELPHRGSSFDIQRVNSSNSGIYHCMARRGKTTFNTENSDGRHLRVSEIPVPTLKRTPWLDVFPSESVKLSCGVQGSSDWTYAWYKDERELQADNSLSFELYGAVLSVKSASASHGGQYKCQGRHKSRSVPTNVTSGLTLRVYAEKPSAELRQILKYDVTYTGDSLLFSCYVNISSGWEYVWYKDGTQLAQTGNNLTISNAVTADSGSYKCKAKRGQTVFNTDFSRASKINIKVRPSAVMTLMTGWSEVFSTDSLVLRCDVQGSQNLWNYTWFKEGQSIDQPPTDKHVVTPQNDPEQSQYTCQGVRAGRPDYSTKSEPFKTKNLLMKRRVLLSISGFIFFGLIAVLIGCIFLRVTRKPAEDKEKMEEANLFLTMAELKARDDAPSPLVEYVTDAALTASHKDEDEDDPICSESTPLPITSQEDQGVTTETPDEATSNGGLISFK